MVLLAMGFLGARDRWAACRSSECNSMSAVMSVNEDKMTSVPEFSLPVTWRVDSRW